MFPDFDQIADDLNTLLQYATHARQVDAEHNLWPDLDLVDEIIKRRNGQVEQWFADDEIALR